MRPAMTDRRHVSPTLPAPLRTHKLVLLKPTLPDVLVYVAASLDGYIARTDGSLDWLHAPSGYDGDYGYADFIIGIDTLLRGRKALESVLGFGSWPHDDLRVGVLSSGGLDLPQPLVARAEVMEGRPEQLPRQLQETGSRRIYLDGGETIRRFLRASLVSEMTITRVPVLLGEGVPLFGPLPEMRLEHIATHTFPDGLVQARYRLSGTR